MGESGCGGAGGGENPGAWEEVEALLEELLARSALEGEGGGERSAADVLTACRTRLSAVREAATALDRRLAEVQRQQDEFLSIVAHDLRTPLVAIQGFSQLLRGAGGLTEKQETYLERILQAVRAMNRMVEDLRTARRLDQGLLSLELQAVDLRGFAADLVEMHREEARQKEVEVVLEAAQDLPPARCDPERLGQAVGNLVQNAIKFSPRGSRVTLRLGTREGSARVEVADRGPGIAEELLPLLFSRFAQGRKASASGEKGFGLGLHICREIVALHGGRVGARNDPEGGSCFWAEIPLGGEGAEGPQGDRT